MGLPLWVGLRVGRVVIDCQLGHSIFIIIIIIIIIISSSSSSSSSNIIIIDIIVFVVIITVIDMIWYDYVCRSHKECIGMETETWLAQNNLNQLKIA